jgi:hypothetical protein
LLERFQREGSEKKDAANKQYLVNFHSQDPRHTLNHFIRQRNNYFTEHGAPNPRMKFATANKYLDTASRYTA